MKKYENLVYGVGAAIVIVGALFKIQHWDYGSHILTLGMIVEAGVFLYSAFEKNKDEMGIDSQAVDRYNKEITDAISNIENLNKMYRRQLNGMSKSSGMSDKLNEVNLHLESLSNVYRSILKTIKS